MDFRREVIERALDSANMLIEGEGTLRSIAEEMGISRQTILNDFNNVLPHIDSELAESVNRILENNKANRASKGGLAMKAKRDEAKSKSKRRN